MTLNESSTELRRAVADRLSGATADLPVSAIARLQHASGIAARGGFRRLARVLPGSGSRAQADRRAAERAVSALARLKGVPMKLGQLAGYMDSRIPDELRPAFSALESHAPALPFGRIRAVVERELGPRSSLLLASMDPRPFAVASIGQVHRAKLDGKPVAVKVRYPGIDDAIRFDFRPAALGAQAMNGFRRRGLRGDALLQDVQARILEECDYERESAHQRAFARCFEEHPVIVVPSVDTDFSTAAVLTSCFVEGQHVDGFIRQNPSSRARQRAGLALFDFYVGSLFLMGAYNADPHPGNSVFLTDGRIAVVDHGSARTFGPHAVAPLRELAAAVIADDRPRVRSALDALGVLPAGRLDDRPVHRVLHWLFEPMLEPTPSVIRRPNAEQVQSIARGVRDFEALARPAEIVFLVRLRVALAAVLERLEARANWRAALEAHLDGRFYLRPPTFDVVVVNPGPRPIELLRALRDELGGAVREAKELLDATPCAVRSDLDRKSAQALRARLRTAGATIDLRQRAEG